MEDPTWGKTLKQLQKERDDAIKNKVWICVFVCRSSGAYHLEPVGNLTSKGFLGAFKRFIGTRGLPRTVRSDQASTFVGARKIIRKEEMEALQIHMDIIRQAETEIMQEFAYQHVEFRTDESEACQWETNPPYASDFGGKHEAAVKQVKIILLNILSRTEVNFEDFLTVCKQIEAVLNSRPLCRIEGEAGEREIILTPAKLLIGRDLHSLPDAEYKESNLLDKYNHLKKIVADFWTEWRHSVLEGMMNRPKWNKEEDNIQVGEIVLMKDDKTPPLIWPLAKVIKTMPGPDGKVRVVRVERPRFMQPNLEFDRSIRKIIQMPIIRPSSDVHKTSNVAAKVGENQEIDRAKGQKKKNVKVRQQPTRTNPPRAAKKTAAIVASVCALLAGVKQVDMVQVSPVESGLMFVHEGDLFFKNGVQYMEINSTRNPETDKAFIQNQIDRFMGACETANKLPNVHCWKQIENLEQYHQTLLKSIENFKLLTLEATLSKKNLLRKQRSKGFIKKIWDFWMGDDGDDATVGSYRFRTSVKRLDSEAGNVEDNHDGDRNCHGDRREKNFLCIQ